MQAGPWPTVTEGEPILTVFRGINLAIAHFMDAAEKAGHTMVPLAWAGAMPGGPRHRRRLRAHEPDADGGAEARERRCGIPRTARRHGDGEP